MPFTFNIPLTLAAGASMLAVSIAANCQNARPTIALQPYTAPDQSASAGIPAGWRVTGAGQTVIRIAGPHGEAVVLGSTVIAHNAAFQLGQRSAGTDLSMPNSASLDQKLVMILMQGAAVSHKPISQVTINSATAFTVPPALGQCGRIVASAAFNQGPMKVMGVLCSLPMDAVGNYKTFELMAQAPAAIAAQTAPTAQAIFRSYKIAAPWLQRKLAPVDAAPSGRGIAGTAPANIAEANSMNDVTRGMIQGAAISFDCADLSMERDTPDYRLPKKCGGTQPD
jgi:hypothetical protein